MRRIGCWLGVMGLVACLAVATATADKNDPGGIKAPPKPLFNGKDLDGWETWLGRPHKSVEGLELKKNDKGEYTENVGLNKDPKKVYTVVMVENMPAIRVSGEIFGALTTKEEYENYHFRCEFKWGEKRWAPRDNTVRDSGILYHCVGDHGTAGTFWMQSQECQVQEKDCGDYWSVSGAIVDIAAERKNPKYELILVAGDKEKIPDVAKVIAEINPNEKDATSVATGPNKRVIGGLSKDDAEKAKKKLDAVSDKLQTKIQETGDFVYKKGAAKVTFGSGGQGSRCVKDPDNEKPTGQWNVMEVITVGQTSVHIVNGKVVMVLENSRRKVDGKEMPLTKGKIQLQSEGAEVYYRNITIDPIRAIPAEYLK